MNTLFDLTGQVILVTGGTGFLGTEFAKSLKDAGATVVIGDITPSADVQMDVTKKESIAAAFSEVVSKHGKIDSVINNAAIDAKFDPNASQNDKLFENYPQELLELSLNVNLLGCVLVAQEAVKHMLKQGSGNIVNIASIYGVVAPNQHIYPAGTQKPVDYSITKGGVIMLTKYLCATYAEKGIRANTYTLGGVFKGHGEEFKKQYGERTPMGRMANPEEVAGPLVFLCSNASSYMNGSNLIADGGWTAW